jgi:hypothetical protein
MESLTHICAKTEVAFKEFYSGMEIGKLEEVAKDWVGDFQILNFSIQPGNKLIIIAEDTEGSPSSKFFMFRFFPGGKDNWNVSADLNAVSNERLLEHLMKNYK